MAFSVKSTALKCHLRFCDNFHCDGTLTHSLLIGKKCYDWAISNFLKNLTLKESPDDLYQHVTVVKSDSQRMEFVYERQRNRVCGKNTSLIPRQSETLEVHSDSTVNFQKWGNNWINWNLFRPKAKCRELGEYHRSNSWLQAKLQSREHTQTWALCRQAKRGEVSHRQSVGIITSH